jgi:predicted DNA-binding transcriptional regulator AlpA
MIPHPLTTHLLGEAEAARILGLSVKTLRRWRWAGQGPGFRKLGRAVRYASSDLQAYIAAAHRTSTSDNGAAREPA